MCVCVSVCVRVRVCVCVPQPKLTDEEGWKRFCLGEMVYLGTSSSPAEPEPALDYSKVASMFQLIHFVFYYYFAVCS